MPRQKALDPNKLGKTRRTRSHVFPDSVDFRDRLYAPSVRSRPPAVLEPATPIPVLDQGETSACTGFALASVLHWFLMSESPQAQRVSPFMLYSMARRYDEFRGSKEDSGSSVRGALKGWYKHGASSRDLWPALAMPAVPSDPSKDWWGDAVRRPLGAYYRVDPRAIADMHVALAEVGILYASALCHAGWDDGFGAGAKREKRWTIPQKSAAASDGGHAFVIIGYTAEGFIIQNSWGEHWASKGRAILAYQDWRENAMDCWVAQMGVVTALHLAIARSSTLRVSRARIQLAEDEKLRNHQIAPYVVNMENDGRLSDSGNFRTSRGDLEALVTTYLERARDEWKLGAKDPIDIAIYAHGGLTDENDAAKTAAEWIPALYSQKIFPIFLMWETGLIATLANIVKDLLGGEPRRTAGLQRWWDERIERTLAKPGSAIWGEMKENGAAVSGIKEYRGSKESGGLLLYNEATSSSAFDSKRDRLHLIGHSAGSILHCHLAKALIDKGWSFASANMMAPAASVDLFRETMLPAIRTKAIARYNQWHLSDNLELEDTSCRAIIGYGRSLLYLVSESFEGGRRTPILGMQKYYDKLDAAPNMRAWSAESRETRSTTHGGFDNDEVTLRSVIRQIKASGP